MERDLFPISLCYSSVKISAVTPCGQLVSWGFLILLIYDSLCVSVCLTLYFQGTSCTSDVTQAGGHDGQTHLQTIWLYLRCQHRYILLLFYFCMCMCESGLLEQSPALQAGPAALITLWPICCSTCFDLNFYHKHHSNINPAASSSI